MSNSQMPKICGSTYPVSRNMLEYYLSQQGFTPISIETSDEDKDKAYSVYAKGAVSIKILHKNTFERPYVRSLLEPNELSLDDFEAFVYKIKVTEEVFDKIIADCIGTPSEEVIRAAKKGKQK